MFKKVNFFFLIPILFICSTPSYAIHDTKNHFIKNFYDNFVLRRVMYHSQPDHLQTISSSCYAFSRQMESQYNFEGDDNKRIYHANKCIAFQMQNLDRLTEKQLDSMQHYSEQKEYERLLEECVKTNCEHVDAYKVIISFNKKKVDKEYIENLKRELLHFNYSKWYQKNISLFSKHSLPVIEDNELNKLYAHIYLSHKFMKDLPFEDRLIYPLRMFARLKNDLSLDLTDEVLFTKILLAWCSVDDDRKLKEFIYSEKENMPLSTDELKSIYQTLIKPQKIERK